jgi:hypothetical protein
MTYRTKAFCKKNRKRYKTQQDLAVIMVRRLRVPKNVRVVVVADEQFEGKKLWDICDRRGFTMIVPVNNRRCFADPEDIGKSSGNNIHDRGKSLPKSTFTRLVLVRGKEETAPYRRYAPRRPRYQERREYEFAHEIRTVAKLGRVGIVYSWKSPVYRPRATWDHGTYKVLVTNDPSLKPERIIELYELRWQIELFFRELKGGLGLGDYQGTSFEAFERHTDLCLLAFLSQEWRRIQALRGRLAPRVRKRLKRARMTEMKALLEEEAASADASFIKEHINTASGRRAIIRLWPALKQSA